MELSIIFLPLIASIISGFFGKYIGDRNSEIVTSSLVSMIGAIVLTYQKREGLKRQSYIKQISRERAEGVEVLEVSSNKGVKIDD